MTHRLSWSLTALIVLLALGARLLPGPRPIDDAYITFRYARNLLAGEGLVYNPGERVLGTTTPLYAGLLAGIGLFAGGTEAPFPEIAFMVNALADAAACLILLRIGRRLGIEFAGFAAALVWAVLPFSVTFAIGGLETSVFVLLLTGLMAAYLEAAYAPAALLASLSLLARPDAALLVLPLAADRLYRAVRRREPVRWHEIAAFSVPLLAWLLPAALFYGSPIPHSIAAKAAAYRLPPNAALSRFIQHYATPFMDNLTFGSAGIAAGLVVYPFLSLLGSLRIARSHARAWPWMLFPWTWFAAYAIANPLIFRWYLTPPLPAYLFSILAGAAFLVRDVTGRTSRRSILLLLNAVLLLAPFGLSLRGWTLHPDHGPDRPTPQMAWIALELKYLEAAAFLRPLIEDAAAPPVIAAADIGALGYDTDAPILDVLGLISPSAVPYYPTRSEYYVNAFAVSPELILDARPDFIVLLEVYGREGLFKNSDFQAAYELIHVVETEIYESEGMLIFRER